MSEERQPLLSGAPTPTYNGSDPQPADAPSRSADPKPPLTRKDWAWRGFWTLLAAFVGFVFIKGFVDAKDVDFDLGKTLKRALGGGLSGAAAMVLQVLSLMPIRTIMNYQYRYSSSLTEATKTLYAQGIERSVTSSSASTLSRVSSGLGRYYDGLLAALLQGPISRFGDTAANVGILALLEGNIYLRKLPALGKTIFASVAAALWRMVLTPIDTVKTTMQTDGQKGWKMLRLRVKRYGVGTLWYGAWATAAATFVGHYPWFATYNYLSVALPHGDTLFLKLLRQAVIGFVASVVSDTISNSLRVVKTYRQTYPRPIGYLASAQEIVRQDGLKGLFGRGLKTRILANGLQGLLFSILWKVFMDLWDAHTSH
ncbi:mitochondrial carrier [Cylindrobasidium torrendii FP15055 ss-10]|uniref:Mitochondrial carrier n=1 Tax=Cylindrobasidium torrendii FP15055 ss-10 TaxID=1314674 RepID=A0A0D7BAL0_9AGAR|nr:mitochondrial carrier [Cylindrobasidium torrendii FP15055 ss-10]